MKKVNTIPNGVIIIIVTFFMAFVFIFISIIIIPKEEGFITLAMGLFFIVSIFYYVKTKHLNFIYISEEGVKHKNEIIAWEDLHITMKHSTPISARNSYDYYFYFDTKYLTESELISKGIKDKGFYIIVNKKRANFILELYNKEVKIIKEGPAAKKIFNIIMDHNENVNRQNKLSNY